VRGKTSTPSGRAISHVPKEREEKKVKEKLQRVRAGKGGEESSIQTKSEICSCEGSPGNQKKN